LDARALKVKKKGDAKLKVGASGKGGGKGGRQCQKGPWSSPACGLAEKDNEGSWKDKQRPGVLSKLSVRK